LGPISVYTDFWREKRPSSPEADFAREPAEGVDPLRAEQFACPPLGGPPRRHGPLQQGFARLGEPVGLYAGVRLRSPPQPIIGPHPLQVAAEGRVVELEL